MEKNNGNKTIGQMIIESLMDGETLRTAEIAEKVSRISERDINVQDISNFLSKISNSDKCDLGYFVERKKEQRSFSYRLKDELLNLSADQIYELSLKTGKNRYRLEDALNDHPELKKHVKPRALMPSVQGRQTIRTNFPLGLREGESDDLGLAIAGFLNNYLKEVLEDVQLNVNVMVTFQVENSS
jgi:hypothetical protein